MNKFLIALFIAIFSFSFSNKTFAKTIIKNKNKNNVVDVVFILDRSGSMGGLESDTIGGFNSMLEKQRKLEGKAYITTVLFDDQYELLHDRVNIAKVNNITEKEYFVRGSTALLDAIGKTIAKEKAIQDTLGKNEKMEALKKLMAQYHKDKEAYFNPAAIPRTLVYSLEVEEITAKRK